MTHRLIGYLSLLLLLHWDGRVLLTAGSLADNMRMLVLVERMRMRVRMCMLVMRVGVRVRMRMNMSMWLLRVSLLRLLLGRRKSSVVGTHRHPLLPISVLLSFPLPLPLAFTLTLAFALLLLLLHLARSIILHGKCIV